MVKKSVKQDSKSKSALQATVDSSVSTTQPAYTEDESDYRQVLLQKLENIRATRESPHDKFNGVGYKAWYEGNDKAANSHMAPRKNPDDVNIVTGTTREKVLAIVSNVINLVFRTNFKAFDKDDNEEVELGESMSDCVERSAQVEMWDDKKIYPYYEIATQGDVFVEDIDVDEVKVDKKKIRLSEVKEGFDFKGFKPEKSMKTMFSGCRRNMLIGTQVYLGNIYETELNKQPCIFTREVLPYETAKVIYGHLPRWKYVPKTLVTTTTGDEQQWGLNWRLDNSDLNGAVEIIKYTDDPNDEYQILINGVMQLPVGFPKPWEFDGYNIVQGGLEPMGLFAYHKSIPCKTKVDQEIIDEMLKLSVLKGQKSYMPPIANYSGQLLSRSMFNAGKVTNNVQKGEIEVLGGDPSAYSLKPSEFQLIDMLKKFIDGKSVDPILQGQAPSRETTATEISTVTAQAKRNLGIMIFGFMSFHLKLDILRLNLLLDSYSKPTGDVLDKVTNSLVKKYRSVSLEKEIGSKGMGTKRIEFTPNFRSPMNLYDEQNGIVRDQGGKPLSINPPKKPLKITQINPDLLRSIKYRWYGEVEIKEKESSMQERILFTDQLATAMKLFGVQSVNMEYAQAQWAQKNKINAKSFFNNGVMLPGAMPQEDVNKVEESPMTKQMRSSPSGVPAAVRQGFGGGA